MPGDDRNSVATSPPKPQSPIVIRQRPPVANNVPSVSIYHASESIEASVRDWFAGNITRKKLDGYRSICIPHPEKHDSWLKIKGAGFEGGPIEFGVYWKSGLIAPVFDFDGRMMEDVASGHDNAYRGGASFQQVVVEHRMSRTLGDLGYRVVPCLGYGRIRSDDYTAWFSLFEYAREWEALVPPRFTIEEYADATSRMGRLLTDIAVRHQLIGHGWFVAAPGGELFLKDLHQFRAADAINMSQISWVMHLFFVLHIISLGAKHECRPERGSAPEHLQAYPFRCFLPDATKAEHDELRWSLVRPYMLRPPESFDQSKLLGILRSNRITDALLELCPREYGTPLSVVLAWLLARTAWRKMNAPSARLAMRAMGIQTMSEFAKITERIYVHRSFPDPPHDGLGYVYWRIAGAAGKPVTRVPPGSIILIAASPLTARRIRQPGCRLVAYTTAETIPVDSDVVDVLQSTLHRLHRPSPGSPVGLREVRGPHSPARAASGLHTLARPCGEAVFAFFSGLPGGAEGEEESAPALRRLPLTGTGRPGPSTARAASQVLPGDGAPPVRRYKT